ncbi:hypothetical protein FACS189411_17270 [Bacteroidia bacterium]|nr:hypothetical protein FACS189411_17270 [Bacteroidia bacterium]
MKKINFKNSVIALTIGIFAVSCNSGGSKQNGVAQQSDSEKTAETKTEQAKVPGTPTDFFANFGLTEADVKPSDAGEGTLEVAPNDPNHGEVVYKSASLKDGVAREKYIKAMLDKARSLATDGKLYTSVSTKEEFWFKQGSSGAVFQYNYGSGYVTFNILCMDGQLTVGLWK